MDLKKNYSLKSIAIISIPHFLDSATIRFATNIV